ncbi:DUF7828 domain-containing protein [Yersinia mollaretii]|uniref:DUF7828 domain-containing protein n=1 Tax=Yersinia mollaretii TaxID=33060 RepID=UPI0028F45BF8|nr:putative zinc ribbon protein [Yersinia mollaretii]
MSCTACRCRLLLNVGTLGEEPWFERDQHTITMNVLMKCAHLDPQVKEEARHNKLRKVVGGLDAPATVLSWYCACVVSIADTSSWWQRTFMNFGISVILNLAVVSGCCALVDFETYHLNYRELLILTVFITLLRVVKSKHKLAL